MKLIPGTTFVKSLFFGVEGRIGTKGYVEVKRESPRSPASEKPNQLNHRGHPFDSLSVAQGRLRNTEEGHSRGGCATRAYCRDCP